MAQTEQERAILHAARTDPSSVPALLLTGAPANTADEAGFTPILYALQRSNVAAVAALAKAGANLTVETCNEPKQSVRTLLESKACAAALAPYLPTEWPELAAILAFGNCADSLRALPPAALTLPWRSRTPATWAALCNCEDAIRAIVDVCGIEVLETEINGFTLLHAAAGAGATATALAIYSLLSPERRNHTKADGKTAFLSAVAAGWPETAVALARAGADPADVDSRGRNALSLLAATDASNGVAQLIEVGTPFVHSDNNGVAVLDPRRAPKLTREVATVTQEFGLLCLAGCKADVVVRLEKEPTVHLEPFAGTLPLFWACKGNNTEIIQILLRAGASLSDHNTLGETPLHVAAARGGRSAVAACVAGGAEVNAADHAGCTPLHSAIDNYDPVAGDSYKEIITYLAAHGANVNATDRGGRTPLHAAAAADIKPLVVALLTAGASPRQRDAMGRLPVALTSSPAVAALLKPRTSCTVI